MPRYEYHCNACGQSFEATQRMSDASLTKCLVCGAEGQVERLMSAGAGVIFKGSGFYQTDYKNAGAAAPSGDSAAATTTKSDAPAATAAPAAAPASTGHSCGSGCGCAG